MDVVVMVAQIILSLSILVGVHEMGHLLAAKYFGMRVEQFSIGFPPKLFKFMYKDTEYALSAIPLGGYVKISGMIDESLDTEAMKAEPQPWEFRSKPAWQRLIVMLGGIIVNVVVGVIIFILITYFLGDSLLSKDKVNENGGIVAYELAQSIGLQTGDQIVKINGQDFVDFFEIGDPKNLLEENASYTVVRDGNTLEIPIPGDFIENFGRKDVEFVFFRVKSEVDSVLGNSLAKKIGLQKGDKIVEVEGVKVNYTDEVRNVLKNRSSDSVTFKVLRGSEYIVYNDLLSRDSIIGFSSPVEFYEDYEIRKEYSLLQSIPEGTSRAFGYVFLQVKAFGKMFSGELNVRKSLSGPIGIAQAYGGNWDWPRFWRMTGLLSMVLAFMNLLPIPALDGGHVMFLSAEIISGRKPSDKFLEVAQKIGMVILLALMVFIFANDIIKAIENYLAQ